MLSSNLVKKLLPEKYQQLIDDYISYLMMGIDHFSNVQIPSIIKLEKINLLEKAIQKDFPIKSNIISKLQQSFLQENLSLYLLLDPIIAWRYLAKNNIPNSETQMSDLVNYAISPLSRMIMVLYDENPATYFPFNSLITFLFFYDEFHNKTIFTENVKISKKQKESKLKGLLKNSKVILSIINSKKLKFKLAILINYAYCLLAQYKKNKNKKISFIDYLKIYLYSIWQFMFIRKKRVDKGI